MPSSKSRPIPAGLVGAFTSLSCTSEPAPMVIALPPVAPRVTFPARLTVVFVSVCDVSKMMPLTLGKPLLV